MLITINNPSTGQEELIVYIKRLPHLLWFTLPAFWATACACKGQHSPMTMLCWRHRLRRAELKSCRLGRYLKKLMVSYWGILSFSPLEFTAENFNYKDITYLVTQTDESWMLPFGVGDQTLCKMLQRRHKTSYQWVVTECGEKVESIHMALF